jgi:error-prone DNA polymerase
MAFAELLGRSCFSFLEGASHPEELYARSLELGHAALALCDRDGLYGSVRMHVAARSHGDDRAPGPRAVVGAELTLEQGGNQPYAVRPLPSLALLVEERAGYRALCRLLTAAHAHHEKGEAGIDVRAVAEEAAGLFALLPLDPRCPLPAATVALVREAFGERCAIATWRHLEPGDAARVAQAIETGERFGMPLVATARPLYHHPERKPLADVVHCIRLRTTLDRAGTALGSNAEAALKSETEMKRLFPRHPEWVARSAEIAARCRFSLDELRYHFPCEYGEPGLDPLENLKTAVERGARERYPEGVPAMVRDQIQKELALIDELEVAPYFLSVKQIVEIARARGILCQGRGSAANSAVCYVLGITAVDPSKSSLLFERFMSNVRHEPPDIDVDFEHERREEVIQEIYARYGRDRAAMVSEVICYRGKSALREVGKVFGLSGDQLDRLSSIAGHFSRRTGASARAIEKRGLDPKSPTLRLLVDLAEELTGFPRHLSIHTGGFVLSSEPLYTVAPVEPAKMADRTVIPWDKDDIEALGFFKVDVLGLGMLTAIRKALALIHDYGDEPRAPFDPILALGQIPPDDSAVYDACCRADTIGVFQIESRAQMAMLPLLKPRSYYDLVVEVGIVRPGPIQGKMVHPYLRRRTGEEPVSVAHPCLVPILERTLGVPLFQEQVMQIAIVGAGYDPGEADQLRRDMAAWRKDGRLERHEAKLLAGFRARGIPDDFSASLFNQIKGFGEYGFPESHAASFALLVYTSAWIKVHHPAAFVCALLNSQPMGFYSPRTLVRDAQRHGVEVHPVSIDHSQWDSTLEVSSEGRGQALRLGFRLIRGLGEKSVESILAARERAPFDGLDDLVRRTLLRRDELDRLAEAGALERLEPNRREALWQLRAPREEEGLFADETIESSNPVGLRPLTAREQLSFDYGSTGLSLHDHPMRHLRPQLARRRVRLARDQSSFETGQTVTVAGVVLTRQRPSTASGVVFVTLEDESGTVNLVLYSQVFEQYELVARHAGIMLARGRVDRRGSVVHIRASHLVRLRLPAGGAIEVRSRDFH